MSKTNNVAVRFLKRWRAYNPKEVAGFDPEAADKLVEGGVAEYTDKARTKRGATKTTDPKKPEGDGKQPDPADDDLLKGGDPDDARP